MAEPKYHELIGGPYDGAKGKTKTLKDPDDILPEFLFLEFRDRYTKYFLAPTGEPFYVFLGYETNKPSEPEFDSN